MSDEPKYMTEKEIAIALAASKVDWTRNQLVMDLQNFARILTEEAGYLEAGATVTPTTYGLYGASLDERIVELGELVKAHQMLAKQTAT